MASRGLSLNQNELVVRVYRAVLSPTALQAPAAVRDSVFDSEPAQRTGRLPRCNRLEQVGGRVLIPKHNFQTREVLSPSKHYSVPNLAKVMGLGAVFGPAQGTHKIMARVFIPQ
jgi:hypothetical protein